MRDKYPYQSVRLCPEALAKLDELAERTMRSRSQVLNLLLLNATEDDLQVVRREPNEQQRTES